MIRANSQPARILALLERGPVTPLESWVREGIYRLADVIHALRHDHGYVIGTSMESYTNAKGITSEHAVYRLVRRPKK